MEPKKRSFPATQLATDNGVLVIHPITPRDPPDAVERQDDLRRTGRRWQRFAGLPKPDLVLVTHIHFDHFDPSTMEAIMPAGSADEHRARDRRREAPGGATGKTKVKILANGEKTLVGGIGIKAVPAYNTTPGKEKFHPKGRDNGYVLTGDGRKEDLHCRRHRGHRRDAGPQRHRRRLPADEPALHDQRAQGAQESKSWPAN